VPFTFVATAGPVALLGAKPVFVDIDPVTYNMDVKKIEGAITSNTKAIIPVDLFGLMASMADIEAIASKHNLVVIEDAAQAIGAKAQGRVAGATGAMGCFSFFPSKNLGAAGDGGAITTDNDGIAQKLRKLRVHGSPRRYEYELLGVNSRLDAVQAAVLRIKLKYLDQWAETRRHNANRYRSLFEQASLTDRVTLPSEPSGYHHIYNQYTIRVSQRDKMRGFLAEKGIPTEVYYPYPLHLQPVFKELGGKTGDYPVSEQACKEVLALPIYPEMGEARQQQVVEGISQFLKAHP
jgi:dTDP-4-amino-4,6-dideoxygalactose transaminase